MRHYYTYRRRSRRSRSRTMRRQHHRHIGGVLTSTSSLIHHLSRPPAQNQARFLRSICSQAHYCLSFGRENERLNNFFDFSSFKWVKSPLISVSSGANGMTTEVVYEREGYKTSAILKTTISPSSDNLFLEAYNGLKYINVFNRYYPCFLETYGAYLYKSNYDGMIFKRLLAGNKEVNVRPDTLSGVLQPVLLQSHTYDSQPIGIFENIGTSAHVNRIFSDYDQTKPVDPIYKPLQKKIANSCKYAANNALLMQYVHNPVRFGEWFAANRTNKTAYCAELPQILFQIYSALAQLSTMNLFTHYDLHSFNVLLYEIPNGKHVKMLYKNGPGIDPLVFETRYIAKIIDYGRSYMPDNANIYKLVCMEEEQCESEYYPETDPRSKLSNPYNRICGKEKGYGFIDLGGNNANYYYINRIKVNNAHDLRLITSLTKNLNESIPEAAAINRILKNTAQTYQYRYSMGTRAAPRTIYGVPHAESHNNAEDFTDDTMLPQIQSVQELYWALFWYIVNTAGTSYPPEREYATLTVDLAVNNPTPMQFVISEGGISDPNIISTAVSTTTVPATTPIPIPAPAAPSLGGPINMSHLSSIAPVSRNSHNVTGSPAFSLSPERTFPNVHVVDMPESEKENRASGDSLWDAWDNISGMSNVGASNPAVPAPPLRNANTQQRGNVAIVNNSFPGSSRLM